MAAIATDIKYLSTKKEGVRRDPLTSSANKNVE